MYYKACSADRYLNLNKRKTREKVMKITGCYFYGTEKIRFIFSFTGLQATHFHFAQIKFVFAMQQVRLISITLIIFVKCASRYCGCRLNSVYVCISTQLAERGWCSTRLWDYNKTFAEII